MVVVVPMRSLAKKLAKAAVAFSSAEDSPAVFLRDIQVLSSVGFVPWGADRRQRNLEQLWLIVFGLRLIKKMLMLVGSGWALPRRRGMVRLAEIIGRHFGHTDLHGRLLMVQLPMASLSVIRATIVYVAMLITCSLVRLLKILPTWSQRAVPQRVKLEPSVAVTVGL